MRESGHENEADAALYYRCYLDKECYSLVYFPHYCEYAFNPMHLDYFEDSRCLDRGTRRVYIGPRGSAKSTISTVFSTIHDICYQKEKFILIISNTQDQALQKIKDIRSELLENERLLTDYGPFFKNARVGTEEFIAYQGDHACKVQAVGMGKEIRGIRQKESRPTKIIFDDIEHSERVENEILRRKDASYFFKVVSKVGSEKTNIEGVGTILHQDSLIQKLRKNPAYTSRLYKSVISWSEREDLWEAWRDILMDLEDPERQSKAQAFYEKNKGEMLKGTKVMWPEKEPYLYLMKEMLEIGRAAFLQEKQNEPIDPESRVFHRFTYYRETDDGLAIEGGKLVPWKELKGHCFGALDPATGQSRQVRGAGPDFASILVAYKHPKTGRVFFHHDWTQVAPPSQQIEQIFNLHENFDFHKFGVEINLYRNLLMQDIVRERKEREKRQGGKLLKLPFYEIEATAPKRQRIFSLEPKVTHGWVVFNRNLSNEFMNQFINFPNAAHDDAPDCGDMAYNLCNGRYPASPISIQALGSR